MGPTEAELQEFTGDVEMEPGEEEEVPVEGKGNAPDREAEVPQAAAAASQPSWNCLQPRERRLPIGRDAAKGPVDTKKKDETPAPTGPGMPISYAPKYTDDDGDLRDTAATPKGASTQEPRGGIHNYVSTPYPEHSGEAPELKPAEVRHHQEQSSYLSSRGSRTSARPAEHRSNRRFTVQHEHPVRDEARHSG